MNEPSAFEMEVAERGTDEPPMLVDVEGFEGPLDLLLALARQQKVDLSKISILALAEQYLTFIEAARKAGQNATRACSVARRKYRSRPQIAGIRPMPPSTASPTAQFTVFTPISGVAKMESCASGMTHW